YCALAGPTAPAKMAKANITLRILNHLLSVTLFHFVCSCPVARFTAINTPPVRRSQPNTFACFDGGDICRPSTRGSVDAGCARSIEPIESGAGCTARIPSADAGVPPRFPLKDDSASAPQDQHNLI